MLKLAQHLRDDGRPFLGEADLVHGALGSTVVATSALVSVDQALVEQRLGRFSTAALHTILVEVALRGDDWKGEERTSERMAFEWDPPAPLEQPSPESPRPLVINPFSQNVVRLLCRNASAVSGRWKCDLTLQTRTSSQLRFYQVNLNNLKHLFFEHRCPLVEVYIPACE